MMSGYKDIGLAGYLLHELLIRNELDQTELGTFKW